MVHALIHKTRNSNSFSIEFILIIICMLIINLEFFTEVFTYMFSLRSILGQNFLPKLNLLLSWLRVGQTQPAQVTSLPVETSKGSSCYINIWIIEKGTRDPFKIHTWAAKPIKNEMSSQNQKQQLQEQRPNCLWK